MTIFYLDASAFVKLYIPERGTEVLEALFQRRQNRDPLAASIFAFVEVNATFRRLLKGGRIKAEATQQLVSRLDYDFRSLAYSLPISDEIIAGSLHVVTTHALRAGDALHLASILEVQRLSRATGQSLVVLTSDHELLAACQVEGIGTLDPEDVEAQERLQGFRS